MACWLLLLVYGTWIAMPKCERAARAPTRLRTDASAPPTATAFFVGSVMTLIWVVESAKASRILVRR